MFFASAMFLDSTGAGETRREESSCIFSCKRYIILSSSLENQFCFPEDRLSIMAVRSPLSSARSPSSSSKEGRGPYADKERSDNDVPSSGAASDRTSGGPQADHVVNAGRTRPAEAGSADPPPGGGGAGAGGGPPGGSLQGGGAASSTTPHNFPTPPTQLPDPTDVYPNSNLPCKTGILIPLQLHDKSEQHSRLVSKFREYSYANPPSVFDDVIRHESERVGHPEKVMNRIVYDSVDANPDNLTARRVVGCVTHPIDPYYRLRGVGEDTTLVFESRVVQELL